MHSLLHATKGGFFHEWQVSKRYHATGTVSADQYATWEVLAKRALSAARLTV